MPDGLDVSPDDVLEFTLTPKEATPKTTLTLKHPSSGSHGEPIAFKVKTTQPRRYLVRPNQGLIHPGGTEQVQILLVEKDKVQLWQAYERLGQSALDSSKDKFLVQSTKVAPSEGLKAGDYEALSNFWTKVMANTSSHGVFNTKLPVKLTASEDGGASKDTPTTSTKSMPKTVATNSKDVNSMSSDQLKAELTNLRSKYDELVSFSVNLTAERDILNNTLEQTKRELNKYLHKSAADGNRSNLKDGDGGSVAKGGAGTTLLAIAAFLFWLSGTWMAHKGHTKFLTYIPGVKDFFTPTPVEPVPVAATPVESKAEVVEEEEGDDTVQEL
mmetsp:Transcript_16691/g.36488  ORF Transcript_16691/g.36488 Transcript_16691/m.36488 type:complete len:328 (+) Transcript_16691:33-1016(+)